MIIERANYVESFTIPDAWREAMWLCVRMGYDYVVEKGSHLGQIRRQLPYVYIKILEPGKRPLSPASFMPPNIPPPTTDAKIEKYFLEKLLDDKLAENEQYVYGIWIKAQLPRIIENLIASRGHTNQATISVGDTAAVFLDDPPCLRVISFKMVGDKLNMLLFFRSWDLVAGMPENLGGLQLIKEYVIACLEAGGLFLQDGEIIAFSDGLHIYDHFFELANMLNVDKIKINGAVLKDKEDFGKTLGEVQ